MQQQLSCPTSTPNYADPVIKHTPCPRVPVASDVSVLAADFCRRATLALRGKRGIKYFGIAMPNHALQLRARVCVYVYVCMCVRARACKVCVCTCACVRVC